MNGNYILKGKEPIPCLDLIKWSKWWSENDHTVIKTERDEIIISTVFLGADHSFGEGPPLLFETMIFKDGEGDQDMRRYSTWKEAQDGHIEFCKKYLDSYTEEDVFLDIL